MWLEYKRMRRILSFNTSLTADFAASTDYNSTIDKADT